MKYKDLEERIKELENANRELLKENQHLKTVNKALEESAAVEEIEVPIALGEAAQQEEDWPLLKVKPLPDVDTDIDWAEKIKELLRVRIEEDFFENSELTKTKVLTLKH